MYSPARNPQTGSSEDPYCAVVFEHGSDCGPPSPETAPLLPSLVSSQRHDASPSKCPARSAHAQPPVLPPAPGAIDLAQKRRERSDEAGKQKERDRERDAARRAGLACDARTAAPSPPIGASPGELRRWKMERGLLAVPKHKNLGVTSNGEAPAEPPEKRSKKGKRLAHDAAGTEESAGRDNNASAATADVKSERQPSPQRAGDRLVAVQAVSPENNSNYSMSVRYSQHHANTPHGTVLPSSELDELAAAFDGNYSLAFADLEDFARPAAIAEGATENLTNDSARPYMHETDGETTALQYSVDFDEAEAPKIPALPAEAPIADDPGSGEAAVDDDTLANWAGAAQDEPSGADPPRECAPNYQRPSDSYADFEASMGADF